MFGYVETFNIHGITVKYAPDFSRHYNITIAAVLNDNSIVVGDSFLTFSPEAQRFILFHELGHLYHDHNKKHVLSDFYPIYLLMTLFRKIPKQEIEADDYAIKYMGKEDSLKAMKETLDYMIKTYGGNGGDLRLRYERLKNL